MQGRCSWLNYSMNLNLKKNKAKFSEQVECAREMLMVKLQHELEKKYEKKKNLKKK